MNNRFSTRIMMAGRHALLSLCFALAALSAKPIMAEESSVDAAATMAVDTTKPVDVYGLTGRNASGRKIHVFPSINSTAGQNVIAANAAAATPPLTYHGGPVMTPVSIYTIFWIPSKLQNGAATGVTTSYVAINNHALSDYPAHGIDNNNTQYYSTPPLSYIRNAGGLVKTYTDTSAYPASGCNDAGYTGTNCITDAQMQAEIQKVITAQKWPGGGLGNIYFLFTSSGEGSCFDSASTQCAYGYYCAYHSATGTVAAPIIYAIEPYGVPTYCQTPTATSPNGDAYADTATTSASHELSESITDPEPDSGWVNSAGNEIGDLCAYNYGTNAWDLVSGVYLANQMWNGRFYELQQEWDNHRGGCVQVGP
jgi:serine protease